jgi:hypothetical protein
MNLNDDRQVPLPVPGLAAGGPLRPELPVWGLLGRLLLMALGYIFVVPAPWTTTYFYRFMADNVRLPDGRRLSFAGQPLDIWYVLMGLALLAWAHQSKIAVVAVAATLASWALAMLAIRWFCANLRSEDGRLQIALHADIPTYIGLHILLLLSIVTIVGWAWVLRYIAQWLCRNVRGSHTFEFTGTGLEILWRFVVFGLASMLIVPIPWMLRWFSSWFISQISVSDRT